MKSVKRCVIWLGVLTALCAACSTGDGDNGPPPTGTKYYAYVTSGINDTVSGYSINTTTGAWMAVPGSPFAARDWPSHAAVSPSGKFACVANQLSSNISVYAITATTGALSEIPNSPFSTGGGPRYVAFDRSGRFLYVMHPTAVSAYSVNSATGVLTEMAGSPYSTGSEGGNSDIKVDPYGYYLLYVTKFDQGAYGYTIDYDTGALSPVPGSPFHALNSTRALSLAMDPRSKFLYVGDDLSGITLFGIEWASGHLALYGSWLPAPNGPYSMEVDPTGRYLYALDQNWDTAFGYIIDAQTGALTGIHNSPFATGDMPVDIAFEPEGKFAYVANMNSGNISVYAVDPATGILTPISGSPFPIAAGISSIAIVKITY